MSFSSEVIDCKLLFSRSVLSNLSQPCGLQRTRLPCPSPSPGACSDSCPLSWSCHPTISSSVVAFSCSQSFSSSGSFPVSRVFATGGQSMGASASVLPMNIQGWFPLWLTGFISMPSKGLSRINTLIVEVLGKGKHFLYFLSFIPLSPPQVQWILNPVMLSWSLVRREEVAGFYL